MSRVTDFFWLADTTFIDQNGTGNCPAPGKAVSYNKGCPLIVNVAAAWYVGRD